MLATLQNSHWQVGILPDTGGSIAHGRIRYSGAWVDVMRPTDPANYNNSSACSSFLMLPWANRIRDGILRYQGQSWQLRTTRDDHTARHGDVRKRAWQVIEQSDTHIQMQFNSHDHADFNFPFACSALLTYRLNERDFIWELRLTNQDERDFPVGFGFHPYFQRMSATMPLLEIPCDQYFVLHDAMPDSAPIAVPPELDFRQLRSVPDDCQYDHLFANRDTHKPVRLVYQDWGVQLEMHVDAYHPHVILYSAPDGSLAVEPQSNANDGFNLRENGIYEAGMLVLAPQQTVESAINLRVLPY